ncbi:MAG: HAD-IA family hydrolase [Synergistaceae bacterium]|nr:HAD-IA family hydrolase [Synergistaceae bacterium]
MNEAEKEIMAVLFDFDMTLVDSSYAIHRCTNMLAKHLGFREVSREEVLASIGLTIEDSWRAYWGDFKQEWIDYYRSNYREEEQADLRLFPGTVETLSVLRSRGIKVGVVSNRRYARRPVESTGLLPLMDVVVGLEDVERAKPEPDSLLKGFSILGIKTENGLYVGDTDIDMKTSVAACTRGIGMTTGNFSGKALKDAGAWKIFDDLRDLLSLTSE